MPGAAGAAHCIELCCGSNSSIACVLRTHRILSEVSEADAIVYGVGSLYTSICPSLILDGVGEAIAAREDTLKVCVLCGI